MNFHGGTYKDGKCYRYEVAKRLCLKVDFSSDENNKIKEVEFFGGCFTDDQIEDYEVAEADKIYTFDNIPIEIRSKNDPYTVFTEHHYNIGKDLTAMFWISIALLSLAFLLILILIF